MKTMALTPQEALETYFGTPKEMIKHLPIVYQCGKFEMLNLDHSDWMGHIRHVHHEKIVKHPKQYL